MQFHALRVTRLIDHAAREFATREVVTCRIDGTIDRHSWADIAHDARRMAQALEAAGVRPGARVATMGLNHAHHLVAWYGAIGMGGVLHTLNPKLHEEQIDYIVRHAGDEVLIYDENVAPLIERLRPRWPGVRLFVCFHGRQGDDVGFDEWLAPHDGDYR